MDKIKVLIGGFQALYRKGIRYMLSQDDSFTIIGESITHDETYEKVNSDLPDLVTLTKIAYEVILEDLEHLVDETVDTSVSDYAILSGIQIHGPERAQYIWPGAMYVVKNGIREQIELTDI